MRSVTYFISLFRKNHQEGMRKHKTKQTVFFHLFVLALAFVLDMPNFSGLHSWIDVANYCLSRVFLLVAFYLAYFWLVPSFLAHKKLWEFSVCLIIIISLTGFVGVFLLQVAHSFTTGMPFTFSYSLRIQFSAMFALFVASAFGIIFRMVTGWYEEMHKRTQLEEEKLRSELLLLKAQINPHFLFNTLNNIDSLIVSDQAKASESLIKLSLLLRYVIYDTVAEEVPLQKEIDHLRAYIDLQSLRYNDASVIVFEVNGEAGDKKIAPMLFIPFVENAFKHGGSAGIMKGFHIELTINDKLVQFSCFNHVAAVSGNRQGGGVGLENTKRRLSLQYPDRHEMTVEQNDDSYHVVLKLFML
jgi:sensor histidine kinase YesM